MNIQLLRIQKSQLNNIQIINGQLICCDNLEAYFDIEGSRIRLNCLVQLGNTNERLHYNNPSEKTIYVDLEENSVYRYRVGQWIIITSTDDILDIVSASGELIPVTLAKDNKRYGVRTLAKYVYMNDGRTLEQRLNDLKNENPRIKIYSKDRVVLANFDNQKIFTIPFPISNYDLEKFPLIIITKYGVVPNDKVKISREQIILDNSYPQLDRDDFVTFIFHYSIMLNESEIDASLINGTKLFVSNKEPSVLQENTVWIDTRTGVIKEYLNGRWAIILNSSDNIKAKVMSERENTTINTKITSLNIPLNHYNAEMDTLMVFLNSTYLQLGIDYKLSEDNTKIISLKGGWDGTVYPATFNFISFSGKALNSGIIDPDNPEYDGVPTDDIKMLYNMVGENRNQISEIKKTLESLTSSINGMIQILNAKK